MGFFKRELPDDDDLPEEELEEETSLSSILRTRVVRWFLVAGCIGFVVAVVLAIVKAKPSVMILVLCPTSVVGLADPRGVVDRAMLGLIMFGGNFLLYGVFGAIAGFAADQFQASERR